MSDKTILVLNAGSSSLKMGLFDADTLAERTDTTAEWGKGKESDIQNHADALVKLLDGIDVAQVVAAGHRVVHGGADYHESVRIDAKVKAAIRELGAVAPLHNPVALEVIEAAEKALPNVPQVAAFDTAFHYTLDPVHYLYALPYDWYEKWGVRRYGFHGLSHAYCAGRAAEVLARPLADLKLVTCHLGSGCSLTAIAGGRSVATTMGFTPIDGIMMATRPGAVDPGALTYLLCENRLDLKTLDDALNHDSGLKGISGLSSDMREIEAALVTNERAALAFAMFAARVREYAAMMVAALGGVDALVFAGGVGEHSAAVRAAVCDTLGWLGVRLDSAANTAAKPDTDIAAADSRVRVLALHTREELMVARDTKRIVVG